MNILRGDPHHSKYMVFRAVSKSKPKISKNKVPFD